MSKPIIYLAGNMTPSPDYYNEWTKKISEDLEDEFRLTYSRFKDDPKFIVQDDLGRLRNSHIVVVNLGINDINHHLTGLIVECYEANKQHKPVYAFYDDDKIRSSQSDSPWLQSFITKEFNSYDDLVHYLKIESNLKV
jgi:nucleoside 2-deoxyribosyltransferase